MEGVGDQHGEGQRGEKEPGVFPGPSEWSLWLELRVRVGGGMLGEQFRETVFVQRHLHFLLLVGLPELERLDAEHCISRNSSG